MSGIVAASTLEQVLVANVAKLNPSSSDLTAWVALTKATTDAATPEYATKVGLFGGDLTGFLADCTTATVCDETKYDKYTGWGIGIQWTVATGSGSDGK